MAVWKKLLTEFIKKNKNNNECNCENIKQLLEEYGDSVIDHGDQVIVHASKLGWSTGYRKVFASTRIEN